MNQLAETTLPDHISQRQACHVLSVCHNSLRDRQRQKSLCGPPKPKRLGRQQSSQPRALSHAERREVKQVLTSDEYQDQPPVQVFHQLLQEGRYLCSISTMHRILHEHQLNGERRAQRPASPQPIPRLHAKGPNQVWTWDSVP